jgi:hypothetical protein
VADARMRGESGLKHAKQSRNCQFDSGAGPVVGVV